MNFLSAIIYMVLAFLLLYRLQYRRAESEDEYFQRFNSLRGLFAIEIVIGHVIRYDRTWLFPLGKFMLVYAVHFIIRRIISPTLFRPNAVICCCCPFMLFCCAA